MQHGNGFSVLGEASGPGFARFPTGENAYGRGPFHPYTPQGHNMNQCEGRAFTLMAVACRNAPALTPFKFAKQR